MFGTEIWIIDKWMTLITLMKEESTFILSYSKIIIAIILYLVLFASSGAGSVQSDFTFCADVRNEGSLDNQVGAYLFSGL